MKNLLIISFVLLFINSKACNCKPYSIDSISVINALNYSEIVVIADIIEIVEEASNSNCEIRVVKMKVFKNYKGSQNEEVIQLKSYVSSRSCGITLKKGIRYLVNVYNDKDKGLMTNICTRTRIFTSFLFDPIVLDQLSK
tara:strand:+ start:105 stop:524 length:420 start_codon:yes stop_codon:yes gene_type:complete